jgi:hypothetical protein
LGIALESKIANLKSQIEITPWCNGNTAPKAFGVILGSKLTRLKNVGDLRFDRKSPILKIANRITPWCNGNTAPFGGVILGSNPSGVAM